MVKNLMGVSSGFFEKPTKEKWLSAVESGLTETELGLWEYPGVDIIDKAEETYALLRESGVNVSSCHLPFGGSWDISALDEQKSSEAVNHLKILIDWASSKNIGIAVIHPSAEPIENGERPARLLKSVENITELGAYAKKCNIIPSVENLPRTCLGNCADEMLVLTDNGKNASICFDVNHILMETHRDFYNKIAPYAVTTHLSDYDRADEKHWIPGDGCIDWAELVSLFEIHNYTGRYIFELSGIETKAVSSPAELVDRFMRIIK